MEEKEVEVKQRNLVKTYLTTIAIIIAVFAISFVFNGLIYGGLVLGLLSPTIFYYSAHNHKDDIFHTGVLFVIAGLAMIGYGIILI